MVTIDELNAAYRRTQLRHYGTTFLQALSNSAIKLCLTRIAESAMKAEGETAPNPPRRVRMPYAD
jgi:hypothetical protein